MDLAGLNYPAISDGLHSEENEINSQGIEHPQNGHQPRDPIEKRPNENKSQDQDNPQ